tara:strand:- start:2150 stop:3049 length:900 start_codon:yes stop_codon:yes gene_type:complete
MNQNHYTVATTPEGIFFEKDALYWKRVCTDLKLEVRNLTQEAYAATQPVANNTVTVEPTVQHNVQPQRIPTIEIALRAQLAESNDMTVTLTNNITLERARFNTSVQRMSMERDTLKAKIDKLSKVDANAGTDHADATAQLIQISELYHQLQDEHQTLQAMYDSVIARPQPTPTQPAPVPAPTQPTKQQVKETIDSNFYANQSKHIKSLCKMSDMVTKFRYAMCESDSSFEEIEIQVVQAVEELEYIKSRYLELYVDGRQTELYDDIITEILHLIESLHFIIGSTKTAKTVGRETLDTVK